MKALFEPIVTTRYADVTGAGTGTYATQDAAIRASIQHLMQQNVTAETLFKTIQEYDLLNAIHDQMVKLGYHPGVTSAYQYVTQDADKPSALVIVNTVEWLAKKLCVKPLDVIVALETLYHVTDESRSNQVFEAETILTDYQIEGVHAYAARHWRD